MNKSHKVFVGLTGMFLMIISVVYLCMVMSLFGLERKAEWWISDVNKYREHLLEKINAPKVLVLSGSNSLFGINSQLLSSELGLNRAVVNLATHAGNDIRYYHFLVDKYLKDKDILILPLEFSYYTRSSEYTDWQVNNYLSWGREFFTWLPLEEKLRFLMAISPKNVLQEFLSHVAGVGYKKLLIMEDVISEVESINKEYGSNWRGYSHKSLTLFGDMTVGREVTTGVLKNHKTAFYPIPVQVNNQFEKTYKDILDIAKLRNAKVILTWPATIKHENFNFSETKINDKVVRLIENLSNADIKVRCSPSDFNLNIDYFFNTNYHLNKVGAEVRTNRLIDCLLKDKTLLTF